FRVMVEARAALRNRIFRETGTRIAVPESDLPSARATVEHGFIHGSPARVAEAMADIDRLGIGGVIASFRLGPMPHETATSCQRLGHSAADERIDDIAEQRQLSTVDSVTKRRD